LRIRGERRSATSVPSTRLVRWLERAWLCAAVVASVATAQPEPPRFVAWQVQGSTELRAGCARLQIWTSKSGKTGAGFSIALAEPAPVDESCKVTIERAELSIAARTVEAALPPTKLRELTERGTYLPFLFDNEATWNAGERQGSLRLQLRINGEVVSVLVALGHVWQQRARDADYVQAPRQSALSTRADAGGPDGGGADPAVSP
jgi:hypothetical protein